MKDRRVLPNGEIEEWDRPPGLPDDYIYDPETDSYYCPGQDPSEYAEYTAAMEKLDQEIAEDMEEYRRTGTKPGLYTAEDLRRSKEEWERLHGPTASPKTGRGRARPKPRGPAYRSLFGEEE